MTGEPCACGCFMNDARLMVTRLYRLSQICPAYPVTSRESHSRHLRLFPCPSGRSLGSPQSPGDQKSGILGRPLLLPFTSRKVIFCCLVLGFRPGIHSASLEGFWIPLPADRYHVPVGHTLPPHTHFCPGSANYPFCGLSAPLLLRAALLPCRC